MTKIYLVLGLIAALSFSLFLLLRQKKPRLMQTQRPPAAPPKKNDVSNALPEARLVSMSDTGMNGLAPHQQYVIDHRKVTIGRAPENTIVIPESTISAFHASIEYVNGHFQLRDNHSSNGTRHKSNRLPPNQSVPLKHGDVIRFATFAFRFLRTDRAPSDATIMMAEILK